MSAPELKTDFEIMSVIESIKKCKEIMNKLEPYDAFDAEMEIMTQLPKFYQDHPFLIKRLVRQEDMSFLFTMLRNLQQVQEGKQTLASTELKLGDELANKFIPAKYLNK